MNYNKNILNLFGFKIIVNIFNLDTQYKHILSLNKNKLHTF